MSIGQNLNITLPTSGQVQWDSTLNTALQALIDAVQAQVTVDGIDIAASLDFQGNYAINLNGLSLKTTTDNGVAETIFWSIPSGGTNPELFVRDGAGNVLQVTSNGALNVSASTGGFTNLAGTSGAATFNSGNGTFTFTYAPGLYATLEASDLKLRGAGGTAYSDVKPSPVMASSYSLTLPSGPSVGGGGVGNLSGISLMTIDSTGSMASTLAPPPLIALTASALQVNASVSLPAVKPPSGYGLLVSDSTGTISSIQSGTIVDAVDVAGATAGGGSYAGLSGWNLGPTVGQGVWIPIPCSIGDTVISVAFATQSIQTTGTLYYRGTGRSSLVARACFNGDGSGTFAPGYKTLFASAPTMTGTLPFTNTAGTGSLVLYIQNGPAGIDTVDAVSVVRRRKMI